MTFAEKLMRLRKREGLSQEALAEALGVSRQAVSRWEQGTALPDAAKLLPCARLFHVSVEWRWTRVKLGRPDRYRYQSCQGDGTCGSKGLDLVSCRRHRDGRGCFGHGRHGNLEFSLSGGADGISGRRVVDPGLYRGDRLFKRVRC